MHQRLYESDHQVDLPESAPSAARRSQRQDRLGNAAILSKIGLEKTPGEEANDPAGEADLGPAEVDHGGSSPTTPPPGSDPIAPLPSGDELIAPIQPPAEEIAAIRPEIAPACDYTQWVPGSCRPDMGGMGGMGGMGDMGMGDMGMGMGGMEDMAGQFEMPQAGTGAQQVATMSDEEFAAYEQQTYDLVNATIVNMNTEEKRSTLAEFGYSGETIDTMDETMMNQALAGTLCKTIRSFRIQGMTPEELDRLPAKEQRQFLTDLGVPAKDLWKAKDRHIRQAVKDVVAVAKTPGHHKVKLKIRGGWFRGKSYDINMQVDDEGHLADVDIEKKGGLFSKIGGLIKMAMPYIAKLLAGVTGGLSLLAYGIYQAVEAARTGDWLQGIQIAAGAFVGAGFDAVGSIISRVGNIAGAAIKGFQAIKSRNLGGIIDAFATGAEGIAGFAKDQLGGFATTCRTWADTARTWGGYAVGGLAVFQSIRGKDPLAAIAGSLDLVVSLRDHGSRNQMGPPTSLSNNPGVLVTSARLFGYAVDARDAATAEPPRWGAFAASMFEMAGTYTDDGKIDTGRDLALRTQDFDTAYRNGDWSAAGQAILDISETIDLAHRGEISDDERNQVTGRYDTVGGIVNPGLQTVEDIQTGDWASALANGLATAKNTELARAKPKDRERIERRYNKVNLYLAPSVGCAKALETGDWSQVAMFAAQLGGELSRNGRVDRGAQWAQFAAQMVTKIESGDWKGALAIGKELWGDLQDLWGDTPKGTVEDVGADSPDAKESGIAPPPAQGGETGTGRLREGPAGDVNATTLQIAMSMIKLSPNSTGYQSQGGGLDGTGETIPRTSIPMEFGTATKAEGDLVAQEMVNMPFHGLVELCHPSVNASIMVCRGNVAVAYPELKDEHPEGWPSWMTWTDVVGAYKPDQKQAVIAIRDGGVPETGNGHGSVNLVVHEVGHAIDHAFDGKTDPAFVQARATCIARLQQEGRDFPEYESQPQAGARESYAESMARFFRPGGPLLVDIQKYSEIWAYWENHHMRRRAQC